MVTNLAACGTILHPERKGRISGQLDPSIVVLDAVGLLFFLVPGVIAFAVDFSNGTIYLSGRKSAQLTHAEIDSVSNNGKVNIKSLEHVLNKKIAGNVDLSAKTVQVQSIKSPSELVALFAANSNKLYAGL